MVICMLCILACFVLQVTATVTVSVEGIPLNKTPVTVKCTITQFSSGASFYLNNSKVTACSPVFGRCIPSSVQGGHYIYSVDSSSMSVGILSLDRDRDEGSSKCTYTPGEGQREQTDAITLTVYIPISSVTIVLPVSGSSNTLTVQENTMTTIQCKTSAGRPQADVRWYIDGIIVSGGTESSTATSSGLLVTNGYLNYTANRNDNGKTLMCEANNTFREEDLRQSATYTVDVLYPPDDSPIIEGYNSGFEYQALANVNVTLVCTRVGGNPLPSLTWNCLGGRMGRIGESSDSVNRSVTWSAAVNQDGNRCTCQSQHQTETSPQTAYVIVHVLYPPAVATILDRKIINGNQLTVLCNASGNPAPSYRWTKLGDDSFSESGPTLSLSSIQPTSSGTYTCHAENYMRPTGTSAGTLGSDTEAFTLDVLYPPTITAIPGRSIFRGNTITVTCQASGNPTPTYKWTKSGDRSFSQSGAILTFRNIQIGSAGTYVCHAENVMRPTGSNTGTPGFDAEEFTLEVLLPTKPERPTLFSIATIRKSFIVLQWTSQFNGGTTQTFVVQYKQTTASNWTEITDTVPDPGQNATVYYILHGVDLDKDYEGRVYAQNAVGKSDLTEVVIAKAIEQKEYSEQLEETDYKTATIVLGVACAILATVILVCAVMFIVRKKIEIFKKRTSHGDKKEEVKAEDLTSTYDEVQNTNEPERDANITSKEMTYETKCVPSMSSENQYEQLETGTSSYERGDIYQNTSI